MNNKLHWTLSLFNVIALILFVSYSFFFKSNKVVYVDAITLVMNYNGMKDARAELEKKMSVFNSNIDTLNMELEEKTTEYAQKKSKLSVNEKRLFEELIGAKQKQFANYQQMVQEKVQNENLQLTQKVLDKINDYVKRYGKEHNYELILAATQQGNIIYGTSDVNITEQIIEGLNREYQTTQK